VVTDRLVVLGGLDREARRAFLAAVKGEIAAHGLVELDCSRVDARDEETLGMLVMVARFAQRRGQRVVLDRPSERLRHDLDDAGVSYLFAWSA
jgi:ABC-type transporter Mla MlaB component